MRLIGARAIKRQPGRNLADIAHLIGMLRSSFCESPKIRHKLPPAVIEADTNAFFIRQIYRHLVAQPAFPQ